MKKVCVVIVTYNRSKYLCNLLNELYNQTYVIDTIIILDNHSTDNTQEILIDKGIINHKDNVLEDKLYQSDRDNIKYYYYYSSTNSGGSGGFNKAFSIFNKIDNKFDYLWVMDDDVLPEKDCLEKMVNNMSDEYGLCLPNRSDDKFKDYAVIRHNMKNPFVVYMQRKTKIYNLDKEYYDIQDMPFEGPLIDVNVVKKVGLPDKDYFIFYDDTDYCRRCLKYTKAKLISNAILHKQIIPKENKSSKMNWRNYYSYRNCIYFDKTYGENWFVKNLSPRIFILEIYLKNIILLRFYNLKIIKKAYKDGMKNIRGKTIEPGSM